MSDTDFTYYPDQSVVDQPISAGPALPSYPVDNDRLNEPPAEIPTTPGMDPFQESIFRQMANMLTQMGLGTLFTYANGIPGGWLWDTIVEKDWSSEAELMIALEGVPEFRDRFAVMFDQRERAAAGQPVQVMTPAEIRAYELQATQIMRAAGLPTEFYDNFKDFHTLIANGISVNQLNQRVTASWNRVYDAPQEYRDMFGAYYGVQGDAVLAAFFLDPTKVEDNLDRYSRAAAIGGIARQQGFDVEKQVAEDLARLGASEQDRARIAKVGEQRALFTETISENEDLSQGDQGLKAAFDVDAESARKVQQRTVARQAAVEGGQSAQQDRRGYAVGGAR